MLTALDILVANIAETLGFEQGAIVAGRALATHVSCHHDHVEEERALETQPILLQHALKHHEQSPLRQAKCFFILKCFSHNAKVLPYFKFTAC